MNYNIKLNVDKFKRKGSKGLFGTVATTRIEQAKLGSKNEAYFSEGEMMNGYVAPGIDVIEKEYSEIIF